MKRGLKKGTRTSSSTPVLMPMPAEFVKGIAEPVVTYAVREGPSATAPSAEEAGDR
jgi:hypothetical protein